MTTIRYGQSLLHAAGMLAFIAMPALGAPTSTVPATPNTTATPPVATAPAMPSGAAMPNSNPYTPGHTTNSQGQPVPDSANQYQPASPLAPIPNCPPGAMCVAPPGTAPTPTPMPAPSPQAPCVPSTTKACPN